jgi:tight adherence protein C
MNLVWVVVLWTGGAAVLWALIRRQLIASESRRRVLGEPSASPAVADTSELPSWFLRDWLYQAGFRSRGAVPAFCMTATLAFAVAVGVGLLIVFANWHSRAAQLTSLLPAALGDILFPLLLLAPWLVCLVVAVLPALVVQSARQRHVTAIERDLPIVLEMMATIGEAGLGFDAALARILQIDLGRRPLAEEFRSFQSDLLAGRPRVEALRRLARRVKVLSLSIVVSAIVQAEQLGMGLATVLRRQADDLRDRRRERANAFANALPVKRLVPMVVCFLPGLFVWTLGPFFVQLFRMADTFTRLRG